MSDPSENSNNTGNTGTNGGGLGTVNKLINTDLNTGLPVSHNLI